MDNSKEFIVTRVLRGLTITRYLFYDDGKFIYNGNRKPNALRYLLLKNESLGNKTIDIYNLGLVVYDGKAYIIKEEDLKLYADFDEKIIFKEPKYRPSEDLLVSNWEMVVLDDDICHTNFI